VVESVKGVGRIAIAMAGLAVASASLWLAAPAVASERKAVVQGIDNRALREQLERAIGESRDPAETRIEARRRARDAQDAAEQLLRSEGYYDYSIETDIIEGDHPQGAVKITLGDRTRIGQTNITWRQHTPDEDSIKAAFEAMELKSGAPARAADVLAGQGRIIATLEGRGYADSAAEPPDVVVDHADLTMSPTFQIDPGQLVKMDGLSLTDLKGRTDPRFIMRLAPWKPGQVYTPAAVAELERRLLDTGVYDNVAVSLAARNPAAPDAPRPVVVALSERSKHTLDFTAGYSTSEGVDFDVRWSNYNQFHRADTLTYEARLATIDSRFGLEWSLPHFWSPGQTLKSTLMGFRTVTDAYTEEGGVISADLTRRFQTTSYFTRGISLTASQVNDKETGLIQIVTLRVVGALALDRSDNPLDPRKGWKLEAHVTPTAIAGDVDLLYVKAQAQLTGYLPLDKSLDDVVAARVHLGSIMGGNIPAVPAADRFFAGGGGSVRGYEYQKIGPHYPDNTPVGGLSLTEASVEYRHRFGKSPFGAVVFFDAGSVGDSVSPDFANIATAVGVGFRYNLGFAPIRADLAFPLQNPTTGSQQAFQIYLSIGQSF
jgi:translocation and assembly module TamA